jgi:transposase
MGRTGYSPELKESIKKRFQAPNPPSISQLSAGTGISSTTLYKWRQEIKLLSNPATSPNLKSAEEKLRIVIEAQSLEGQDLGSFLRKEGVYLTNIDQWRAEALKALKPMAKKKKSKSKQERDVAKKIQALEAELKRKDAALAEAAALLLLAKKAEALWAEEDDDTAPNNGRGFSR